MLVNIVLVVIAIVLIAIGVQVIRIGNRMHTTFQRVNETLEQVNPIVPQISQLVDNLNEELAALAAITSKADRMVGRAEEVTAEVSDLASSLISNVNQVTGGLRYMNAALVGAKVGLKALLGRRHDGG